MSKFNYKAFTGTEEYSYEDGVLFGKIDNIENGLILYSAEVKGNLEAAFIDACEDYLKFRATYAYSQTPRDKSWLIKDNVASLFKTCVSIPYDSAGSDVNYKLVRNDSVLNIFFQGSDSALDWINNFKFRAKPYDGMPNSWKCHGGFLQCWNIAKPFIEEVLYDTSITDIIITGYSHGAAIAALCHEFCWYNRPDIRNNIRGYGIGCPRIFAHWAVPKSLKRRWANFFVVRKDNDLVTHVPFKLLRFSHVSRPIVIGSRKDENMIKSHYPDVYIRELENYIEKNKPLERNKK